MTESVVLPPYSERARAEKYAPAYLQNVWQANELAGGEYWRPLIPLH